jgi:cell division protein FtsL
VTRLSIMLLAAVVVSALYLVRVQYDSRRLFTELDRAEAESQRLDTERGRLEVEKRAEATSLRVEKLAKEKLAMRTVTPAITEYVTSTAAVPAALASAASAASATAAAASATAAASQTGGGR